MVFKCPDCGKVKYYNSWRDVDEQMEQEVRAWKEPVTIIPVKCPKCKVKK